MVPTSRDSHDEATAPNVIIPGDPEREMESERKTGGIPLNDKVVIDLKEVGKRFDLAF